MPWTQDHVESFLKPSSSFWSQMIDSSRNFTLDQKLSFDIEYISKYHFFNSNFSTWNFLCIFCVLQVFFFELLFTCNWNTIKMCENMYFFCKKMKIHWYLYFCSEKMESIDISPVSSLTHVYFKYDLGYLWDI